MKRRDFLKQATVTTGALIAGQLVGGCSSPRGAAVKSSAAVNVCKVRKPLAIAMWDFSWLLRHHRYGEFEDWDKVLDGLAERGYNAIRIDAMPQYVAADADGKIIEEFRSVRQNWEPVKWGNYYTMSFRPREALVEFLGKCNKYGIKVGLATWFYNHETAGQGIFTEEGGLLRAWQETLTFLEQNNLLDNVIYVDLLNEYPFWHGYQCLSKELDALAGANGFTFDKMGTDIYNLPKTSVFNAAQKRFYNDFANDLIIKLKAEFPRLDFFASFCRQMLLEDIDLSNFAALDYHIWFADSGRIPGLNELGNLDQSKDNRAIYKEAFAAWQQNRDELIEWMDGNMKKVSDTARKYGICCGNTEGWGPVHWMDHPDIGWEWTKDAGEICVDLAKKYDNYKFICTSNFTHPQFRGIWDDIKWHRRLTSKIKA
jgi:hypothetical protein